MPCVNWAPYISEQISSFHTTHCERLCSVVTMLSGTSASCNRPNFPIGQKKLPAPVEAAFTWAPVESVGQPIVLGTLSGLGRHGLPILSSEIGQPNLGIDSSTLACAPITS